MTGPEVSAIIMDAARRVPPGGTLRIRNSEPVSAYNFAKHMAVIVARASAGEDIYNLICNQRSQEPKS